MSTDLQYAYAVARIRTVENKLLDKGKLERMVEAKTPEEALKVLAEAGYGSAPGEVAGIGEYEKLLKEEEKKVYKLLKEIAPEPKVFDLFLLRNDYHNVKVILKAEFLGQDSEDLLLETGSIPHQKLRIMVRDRSLGDLHPEMKKAVLECIDTFNRTGDPQIIDLILDKANFSHMKDIAIGSNNNFIKGLVEIWIDLNNIKTFLRVKRLGKSWDFLQKVLLEGGSLSSKFFIEKLNNSIESFKDALVYTPYGRVCEEGFESFQQAGTLTRFEKLVDNFVMAYIKKSRLIPLGIEPLVGYLMAKETEIKNARIIMVSKINNISSEIIRERLREAYV